MVHERLKLSGVTFVSVSVPSCGSASEGERNTGEETSVTPGAGGISSGGLEMIKDKAECFSLALQWLKTKRKKKKECKSYFVRFWKEATEISADSKFIFSFNFLKNSPFSQWNVSLIYRSANSVQSCGKTTEVAGTLHWEFDGNTNPEQFQSR